MIKRLCNKERHPEVKPFLSMMSKNLEISKPGKDHLKACSPEALPCCLGPMFLWPMCEVMSSLKVKEVARKVLKGFFLAGLWALVYICGSILSETASKVFLVQL